MSEAEKECVLTIRNSGANSVSSPTSSANQQNPIELLRKLDTIKEIKVKSLSLQRIRLKLAQEVECIETETKSMQNFQKELDLLIQEKEALIEELNQIENDIETMQTTMRDADKEKKRAVETAKLLHTEYKPLKEQINNLRESVGLEKNSQEEEEFLIETLLSKLSTDDQKENFKITINSKNSSVKNDERKSPFSSVNENRQSNDAVLNEPLCHNRKDAAAKNNNNNNEASIKLSESLFGGKNVMNPHCQPNLSNFDLPVQLATAALMAHSLRSHSPNSFNRPQFQPMQPPPPPPPQQQQQQQQQSHIHQPQPPAAPLQQPQHFNPFILSQQQSNNEPALNNNNNNNAQNNSQAPSLDQFQSFPAPFRQQPPPMKACLSCNQQIHRNAPICPLCKAKSRSRNPKKPKKKGNCNEPTSPNSKN